MTYKIAAVIFTLLAACGFTYEGRDIEYDPLGHQVLDIRPADIPNYRDGLRQMVRTLKEYTGKARPGFIMLARNGMELIEFSQRDKSWAELMSAIGRTGFYNKDEVFLHNMFSSDGLSPPVGTAMRAFARDIDGIIMDATDCKDFKPTDNQRRIMDEFGVALLGISHCKDGEKPQKTGQGIYIKRGQQPAFSRINNAGVAFNADYVNDLRHVKNVLILDNSVNFSSRDALAQAVADTNYDLVIVDLYMNGQPFSAADVRKMQFKQFGGRRLVLAKISMTAAADRYPYYKAGWKIGDPPWLRMVSPIAEDEIIADYTHKDWQSIFGINFKTAVLNGFDGVMLDGIEAYKLYEFLTPID